MAAALHAAAAHCPRGTAGRLQPLRAPSPLAAPVCVRQGTRRRARRLLGRFAQRRQGPGRLRAHARPTFLSSLPPTLTPPLPHLPSPSVQATGRPCGCAGRC